MLKKIVLASIFFSSVSVFATNGLYVGRLNSGDVELLHLDITRMGAPLGTMHNFGNDVILKYTLPDEQSARRLLAVVSRKYPRQKFELEGGGLQRRVKFTRMTSAGFQPVSVGPSGILAISHSEPVRYSNFYRLFSDTNSTAVYLRGLDKPSPEAQRVAQVNHNLFMDKLAVYPKDEIPQAYIHCSPMGICWCEGYGSCNNLISACAESDADWGCTEFDDQGGCISGACAL